MCKDGNLIDPKRTDYSNYALADVQVSLHLLVLGEGMLEYFVVTDVLVFLLGIKLDFVHMNITYT